MCLRFQKVALQAQIGRMIIRDAPPLEVETNQASLTVLQNRIRPNVLQAFCRTCVE